jgi:ParB family chromosome partitioning protein
MSSIISVSPFRVKMWSLHDRLESHLSEKTCRAEIESVSRRGQLVPALGRPTRSDPEYDIELVCGARRLFVARHLNLPLLVDLRDMSDKDAIVAMDIENRQRQDVSPYERGLAYATWLRTGQFASQEELAKCIQVSASQVSRLLKLGKLPPVILSAFQSPTEICEEWGLFLAEALSRASARDSMVARAREIATRVVRPAGREVYRDLVAAAAGGRRQKAKTRDEVVKDIRGNPLYRVRQYRDTVALLLPTEHLSQKSLEDIRNAVTRILRPEGAQVVDLESKRVRHAGEA